jgi:hypothetical protein
MGGPFLSGGGSKPQTHVRRGISVASRVFQPPQKKFTRVSKYAVADTLARVRAASAGRTI